jgi:hypothetical protein
MFRGDRQSYGHRASRSVLFAPVAAEVVHLVQRYSEVARGAMIADEIVDKLLALPAAITRTAEMIGDSAQNGVKRERLMCGESSASFAMRVARHDKLPKSSGLTFLA